MLLWQELSFGDVVLEKRGTTKALYMLALKTGLCLAILGPSSSY